MKTAFIGMLMIGTAALFCGCASVSAPYTPTTVGSLQDQDRSEALQVCIGTRSRCVSIGQPIEFEVIIRNTALEPIWVPADIDVLFTWIYPNGGRDNFMREFQTERFYSKDEAVLLKPGHALVRKETIKTYYFHREGITEFRAVVHSGGNTNPELKPFWQGEIESNGYGVLVGSEKKRGLLPASLTETSPAQEPTS